MGSRWIVEITVFTLHDKKMVRHLVLTSLKFHIKYFTLTLNVSHGFFCFSQNLVRDVPLTNYPDVCTDEPSRGSAFCADHCEVAKAEEIPTGLRAFAKFAKNKSGTK